MAETVLSMARSMLRSAISKAAAAAAEEMSLLMGVQKEIWFMKDELKTMQAFLIAAEVMKKKDLLLKVWAEQVRSLSYDIEDCLDEFMVHVRSQSLSQQLKKLKDRHRIAVQIRNLKARVEEVSNRNTRYNLINIDASSTICEIDSNMEDVRNHAANNINEAELVGFATPKRELLDKININVNDGHARVICVVGMGGLGKTTLVRKIYESKEDIAKNFSCCAWIIVSQSFSKTEMLKDMIKQLLGTELLKQCLKQLEGKAVQVEDLASYLRKGLDQKRYFIVLDDLWNIHDWKLISSIAFPSDNNKGSRIIITTRENGIAEACTTKPFVYSLKPLEEECAIDLLLRKIGRIKEDMENDKTLKTIVTKLVKKCGCLPLAILTIGAIFATTHDSEWENLFKQLPSELESNPNLEAVRRMVTLSYSHLPSYLKPCFLYLSIFPEDFEIKRRCLVDRWIAEGFVRARFGMSIEDVGESYFCELMKRSMIIPSRVNIEGNVKRCRVHDIMRDIIVSFSREENFAYFIQGNGSNVHDENFRHVAYLDIECPKEGMDWSHIRSLTFFTDGSMDLTPSICSAKFRMLRVLDLVGEHFIITQNGMDSIMLLFHLKYLNVKTSQSLIYSVPRSISKVKGLQILEMGFCYITTLPTEITKLRNLRGIRCTRSAYDFFDPDEPKLCMLATLCLPMLMACTSVRARAIADLHMGCSSRWSQSDGVTVPRGIGSLKELQVLETVDIRRTNSRAVKELAELTQLRKLVVEIEGATKDKCKILCASIEKLSSLRSLRVIANERQDRGGLEWFVSSSSPPPHLRTLRLTGYIGEMTDWFRDLTQLVKIYLSRSQLKDDKTMKILGELPKLMLLQIGAGAYLGEKLVFRTGAFMKLKILHIWNLMDQVEMVVFEEGTSPKMEMVEIGYCQLASGIIGIKHLPRLKEISLGCISQVARLGMLEDEVNGHHNHPVLRLAHDRNIQDLGDIGGSNVEIEATESVAERAGESSQVITLPTTDSEIQPASG